MQNMDCKNQIIKSLLALVFIFVRTGAFSQNCTIEKWPIKPLYFTESGLINTTYEQMKKGREGHREIMFINFLNFSNQKIGYYISIDSLNRFEFCVMTEDSILYSGCLNTTKKYNLDCLKANTNQLDGFFRGECKDIVSSHKKQCLIITNSSPSKWIEYMSMDGFMVTALRENFLFEYLKKIHLLLQTIFKDLGYKIDL